MANFNIFFDKKEIQENICSGCKWSKPSVCSGACSYITKKSNEPCDFIIKCQSTLIRNSYMKMHKNNFGEDIPKSCCKGWRYITKEQANRIAEIYVEEFRRNEGDFDLDFKILKEAVRLKDEDRVRREEKWQEQQGL